MGEVAVLEVDGSVGVIRFDDGKANALDHPAIDQMGAALDRAEAEEDVGAIVLVGRPGLFSAGFDLATLRLGGDAARNLVDAGARLAMRLYGFPRPVVAACTGHALAAGAILLMASDLRIGADNDAKIGLNEVAIGMPLPVFAVELARARLSRRHYTRATSLATIYDPRQAIDVGYLDEIVAPDLLEQSAIERAGALAGSLSRSGFARTRRTDRQATIEAIVAALDEDLGEFGIGS